MNEQVSITEPTRPLDTRLRLGAKFKDLVTGFEGIAYVHVFKMSGNVQYGLVPHVTSTEPTKMPEMQAFDEHLLEVVDNGVSDRAVTRAKVALELGDEVKHVVTGITGIVTSMSFFINGCCYAEVQPKAKKGETTEPTQIYAPNGNLMVTKKQAVPVEATIRQRVKASFGVQPPPEVSPAPEPYKRPPGGPMTKLRRLA